MVTWPADEWQIGVPLNKFPTFNLVLKNRDAQSASFQLSPHRVFAGLDVYNEGPDDATVIISSPQTRELTFRLKARELRRIRTGWRDPSSFVRVYFANGKGLRFDNLALIGE